MMKEKMKNADEVYMASTFSTINKMLSVLDKAMDSDVFDESLFCAERFRISKNRFARILIMALEAGLIDGIKISDYGEPDEDLDGKDYERFGIKLINPAITLDGLQFLAENCAKAQLYKVVKSVKDIVS